MAKYLLPCSCGRKITVETRHAGRLVSCECGLSIEVPTMLALRELQRAEEADAATGGQWGIPQAIILMGMVILLAAVSGCVWLAMNPPPPLYPKMDEETIRRDMEKVKPRQTLDIWKALRQPLSPDIHPVVKRYKHAVFVHRVWIGILVAVGALGATLVIGGRLLLKRISP